MDIQQATKTLDVIRAEISKSLVGQERLLDRLLIALITGGHILLEGVPGLAKTTAVRALAKALSLQFQRISFTPDLLPSDVIGTLIYNQKLSTFEPKQGPVFTNLLLADEINRAPAKVQSALLEAMQERQVTLGDTTYSLPEPFLVLATQNPIELEGTYPLPEAQTDRFMLKCMVSHPSREDERRIMNRFTKSHTPELSSVANVEDLAELKSVFQEVYCDEKVGDYILDIVFATRDPSRAKYIHLGASPRATINLNLAARANALIQGRAYATPQDVKDIAYDVLRHRIALTYEAEAENITPDSIISDVLNTVPVP